MRCLTSIHSGESNSFNPFNRVRFFVLFSVHSDPFFDQKQMDYGAGEKTRGPVFYRTDPVPFSMFCGG